jgi:hypothetical protein
VNDIVTGDVGGGGMEQRELSVGQKEISTAVRSRFAI